MQDRRPAQANRLHLAVSSLSTFFAALLYIAVAVCFLGLAWKIADYARTPVPLSIPVTPAPTTSTGVALRMVREVVCFESLFKANRWLWLFGWTFHMSLLLVLIRHLRHFLPAHPDWLYLSEPIDRHAGLLMIASLAGLSARRWFIERIRHLSAPSDHLWLVLLLAIGLGGLAMRHLMLVDVADVRIFISGLLHFDIPPLPAHPVLFIHLLLASVLLILLPFSKLLHAPGAFFSPTRTGIDNPRESRHVAPWAAPLEKR